MPEKRVFCLRRLSLENPQSRVWAVTSPSKSLCLPDNPRTFSPPWCSFEEVLGPEHVRALLAGAAGAGMSSLAPCSCGTAESPGTPGTGGCSPPVGAVFCRLVSRAHCCHEAGWTCCLSVKLDIFKRGPGSCCVLLFPCENRRKWADLTKGILYCSDVFPFIQSFSLCKIPRRFVAWASPRSPPPGPSISHTRQRWGLLICGPPDPPDHTGVLGAQPARSRLP